MDCCSSPNAEALREQRKVTNAIDEELRKHKKEIDKDLKLLLLGAGDSGKSTIAKQMKIIHLSGFPLEERKAYTLAVLGNLITAMQALIRAVDACGYKLPKSKAAFAKTLLALNRLEAVSPEMRDGIIDMFNCKAVQKTVNRRTEYYLPDSGPYFFEHMERILTKDYIPDAEDILRTRIRTMGIYELSFVINGNMFRIVDVGGQRSERRKWIRCFQDVTAILFCVALSEYNLALEEDPTVNRMHESLQLFTEICESDYFQSVSIILFLNKMDIFQEKIKVVNLDVCFPEYTGGLDYDKACKFLKKKFRSVNQNGRRGLYPHVTQATNTENIRYVFEAVKDTILHLSISRSFGTPI